MGLLRGLLGSRRMDDPVRGTAHVVGASAAPHATHGTVRLTLVVAADGLPSTPVEHSCMCAVAKWPVPGETLPVTVDRTDPARLRVEWDEVSTSADDAWSAAQAMAAGGGGAAPTVAGTETIVIDAGDGLDAGERAQLAAFGLDADALLAQAEALRAQFGGGGPVPGAGPRPDLTAQLSQLAALRESGALSEQEFAAAKARLLGG